MEKNGQLACRDVCATYGFSLSLCLLCCEQGAVHSISIYWPAALYYVVIWGSEGDGSKGVATGATAVPKVPGADAGVDAGAGVGAKGRRRFGPRSDIDVEYQPEKSLEREWDRRFSGVNIDH